jgi:signal transduction histidine kinase
MQNGSFNATLGRVKGLMTKFLRSPFVRYASLIFAAVVLITMMFPGFVRNLLSTGPFMPHATCYLRDPGLIRLHVSTDLAIGIAYVVIASTLGFLVMRASRDLPFHWIYLAFGIFIVSCGFTHFMEVWTVWQPLYWLSGYVKVITAVASVTTSIALFPLIPRVFRMIQEVKAAEQRRTQISEAHQALAKAHLELQQQKLDLEQMNRDLQMFAYSAAHDLRGPARAISGLAALLDQDFGESLPSEARDVIARLGQSSQAMNRLLSDLLEYTRVGRGEVVLEPVSVKEIVQQALNTLQPEIEKTEARVSLIAGNEVVVGSPTLLLQVIANLLGNALKYVPNDRKPEITVRVDSPSNDMVRIAIEDNGLGIPEDQHEKIFGLFVRLHHSREYPGTGLGLAIVQRAVERMKGKVGVDSKVGQGSTFWVQIRKAD